MNLDPVIIVGAGMVGLSTAYFLQERGVQVTVVDRFGVSAGSSWGNAGWLAPALTVPLPEPDMLGYGIRSVLQPGSALHIPLAVNLRLVRFLAGFALHCTPTRWRSAMAVFTEVNRVSMDAFDELTDGAVAEPTHLAEPLLNAFATTHARDALARAFDAVVKAGGVADFEVIDGDELRAIEPILSDTATTGLRWHGQRFIDPPRFTEALAEAVRARGGVIVSNCDVVGIRDLGSTGVEAIPVSGEPLAADAVVIASGAWLGNLASSFGVRRLVQAGKGYNFSVIPEVMPTHLIDLPSQHVACTPLEGRLRISGVMDLNTVERPFDPRRLRSVVDAAIPMMTGIDWESRSEEWVGSRPCTSDGIPLVGRTKSPRDYVAGGHGMWGITLGPITGKYLASLMTGGNVAPVMRHFDPLR